MTGKWFDIIEDIVSNMSALGDSRRRLPETFPTVAGTLEQVCMCSGGVY
jgi:hypothetical protein